MRRAVFFAFLLLSCASGGGEEVEITYRRGERLSDFVREMRERGVINSERVMKVLIRLSGIERRIKPGVYVFEEGEGEWKALGRLKKGPILRHFQFTIKEGEALREFLPRLSRYGYDTVKLLNLAFDTLYISHLSRRFAFLKGKKSLEGFLYPDTYFIDYGAMEEEVFIPPLERFKAVWDSLRVEERSEGVGLSPYEVLILASVVEKEAVLDEEKPLIASVFLNRLRRGMPLAADPTIKYVLENPPKILSFKHTRINSPYNTYRFTGLPPTPICSPSAKTLEAVLNPAETDYLFFASADGRRHRFARTYKEHLRNVRRMNIR